MLIYISEKAHKTMSFIQYIYDNIQTFIHIPSTFVKEKGINKLEGFEI